ncbi:MAG: hypothetical protein HYV60_11200, partial [Planctomycetia bacterium]|nr:hypothetical protein [Planctomycetia bacterium]
PGVTISGFSLSRDTGRSAIDKVTGDPRVTGLVGGGFNGGYAHIEFDRSGDGAYEGYVSANSNGTFVYDPRDVDTSFVDYVGSVTINYRVVEYEADDTLRSTGDWVAFSFTMESSTPANGLAVTNVQLLNDTGTHDDGITMDPVVIGTVAVSSGASVAELPVQVDLGADGYADGAVLTNNQGNFQIDLSPALTEAGPVTINVRAGAFDTSTSAYVFSDWIEFSFTWEEPPLIVPAISNLRLVEDTGDPTDNITTLPSITGDVSVSAGSVEHLLVQYDLDGDEAVEGAVFTNEMGAFVADFSQSWQTPEPGAVTISVRAGVYDDVSFIFSYSDWQQISFTYEEPVNVAPNVQSLQLANDTDIANDGITSDPRVVGELLNQDGTLDLATVQYDLDDDGIPDGDVHIIASDGTFEIDLSDDDLVAGAIALKVRGRELSTTEGDYINGAWQTFSFMYAPVTGVAPEIQNLQLVSDTGTPNDLITDDMRITGVVTRGTESVDSLPVQYDLDGDGTADGA